MLSLKINNGELRGFIRRGCFDQIRQGTKSSQNYRIKKSDSPNGQSLCNPKQTCGVTSKGFEPSS